MPGHSKNILAPFATIFSSTRKTISKKLGVNKKGKEPPKDVGESPKSAEEPPKSAEEMVIDIPSSSYYEEYEAAEWNAGWKAGVRETLRQLTAESTPKKSLKFRLSSGLQRLSKEESKV